MKGSNEKKKDENDNQKDEDKKTDNETFHLVGLKNQGATCYLNCVLQSLFHIPAFRFGVYKKTIREDESNLKKSVIYQLQILFMMLHSSKDSAVSTRQLTTSFGWKSSFLRKPQDPHFFLHWLLADALINDIKKVIDDLFEGKIRTTITGEKKNQKKYIDESFYDLSMIVKDCSSLKESFSKYIEPEEISQYKFSPYKDFTNATIKTSFLKMPKILYLHLKRSEYTFTNRKIMTYFSFPSILDISPYLDPKNEHTGSTQYELFGVIVHHGSTAVGGHYYSYLRTSKEKDWYKFNDSLVTKSTEENAISKNFGGIDESPLTGNGTIKKYGAYMLIYVQQSQIDYIYNNKIFLSTPENIMKVNTNTAKDKKVTFLLFNDDSYIANSARSCINLTEKGYHETISIKSKKSISQFYEKIAKTHGIKVSTFRLWTISEQYQFYSILDPKSSKEVDEIESKKLYMDKNSINENDNILISNKKIIFIFFYFRLTIFPLRFLFSMLIDEDDKLEIVVPKLASVLSTTESNIKKTKCYRYYQFGNSSNIQLTEFDISIESSQVSNGSCYIFQYKKDKDLSHAPFYYPIHQSTSNEIYLIEKIRYKAILDAQKYFQTLSETSVFDFTDNFNYTSNCSLICPSEFPIRYFLELISKVSGTSKYQIFTKRIQKPIAVYNFEKIGQLFDYILKNNDSHIPLLFVSSILDPDIIPVNVIISYDAVHPFYYERVFIKPSDTTVFNDLLSLLTKKIDESYPKNEIRVLTIKNKMIDKICNLGQPCDYKADWIRFEIIPSEQRIKFATNVEKLCQCRFVGDMNKIEELPFLFIINNKDTLNSLKEKIVNHEIIYKESELYLIKNKKIVNIKEEEVIFSYIDNQSIILIRT